MKILLTGACGLVARAILRHAGDVDTPDSNANGNGNGVARQSEHEFVPLDVAPAVDALPGAVRASVADRDAVFRAAEGCDAIVHTAALHGGFRGKASNQEYLKVNVIGAENLFEAAIAHGIKRLVISSTLEVLCGGDWYASGRTVYTDDSPPRPDWIYPLSKQLVEDMGHAYVRTHQLEVVQLRYAWVRRVPMEKIRFGLLARSIADSDVAEANLLSVTTPGLTDHVFNICPETPFDQSDIDLAMRDVWAVLEKHWPGSSDVLRHAGYDNPDPDEFWPVTKLDRVRQIIGWRPKATFDAWLRQLGWREGIRSMPEAMPIEPALAAPARPLKAAVSL